MIFVTYIYFHESIVALFLVLQLYFFSEFGRDVVFATVVIHFLRLFLS